MKTKDLLSLSFTGVLVICGVIIVGLVIRQEFFSTESHPKTLEIENWQHLKLKGYRSGPETAPVQIVEFFDYQCPFCKKVEPALQGIKEKYGAKINIIYQHFPLESHRFAFEAAVAAECSRRQNKFKTYHNLLFEHQKQIGTIPFGSLAVFAEVPNIAVFKQCVESEATAQIVRASKSLGSTIGVSGTPTFLINGTLVVGALPQNRFEGFVESALAEAVQ